MRSKIVSVAGIKIGLILIVLVFLSLACSNSTSVETPSSPENKAWYACTLFVDDQLDISYLDAQKFNISRVKILSGNKYQVTVYYAKLDRTFQCVVFPHSDGNWELISLDRK